MGILNRIQFRNEGANELTASSDLEQLLRGGFGISDTARQVTPKTAKGVGTVYACTSLLARSIASLPFHMYEREGENNRKVSAREHPIAALLKRPSRNLTTYDIRDFMQRSRGLYGKSYIWINSSSRGPNNFEAFHPDSVEKKLLGSGRIVYKKGQKTFTSEQIIDIPWSTWIDEDGLPYGVGPVQEVREAIGVAIETERHGGNLMANSAVPAGLLTGPLGGNKEAIERTKESWQASYGGKNKYKTAVLDKDWDWKPLTLPAKDAQFIEQRRFSVEEIARIFNVPASMINDNEKSTFSNADQQALNYVVHSLMPHLVAIETEMNDKLFPDSDQYFVKFNVDGLLRGDYKSRMEGHALAIQNRIINPNEARAMEERNAYEGGDEYRNPNIEPSEQSDPEA